MTQTIRTLYADLQRERAYDERTTVLVEKRPSQLRRNLVTLLYVVAGLWAILLGYITYTVLY